MSGSWSDWGEAPIVVFGEGMVELSAEVDGGFRMGFAGDALNTAIYLSRLGAPPRFVTALGASDPFSEGMLNTMRAEGVDTSAVARIPDALPGLYMIETAPDGERRFFYWRAEAPIRRLLTSAHGEAALSVIHEAPAIYLTGVTLAVIGAAGRAALEACLNRAPTARRVVFDANHRPSLWGDDDPASAFRAVLPHCRLVSLTEAEAHLLMGSDFREQLVSRSRKGLEAVVRNDDCSAWVASRGGSQLFETRRVAKAVDTTAAGDSFNAAYLAARRRGESILRAVDAAQTLAAAVVGAKGAVLPRDLMPGDHIK